MMPQQGERRPWASPSLALVKLAKALSLEPSTHNSRVKVWHAKRMGAANRQRDADTKPCPLPSCYCRC